jgi:alpha-beta hydrolase superfamily lysophospholipase
VIPLAQDAAEEAGRNSAPKKHLVILVHGIRDIARWKSEVAAPLRKAGLAVEPTNYGRMNLIEFLLPIAYFRQKAIEDVWIQIQHAIKRHPGAKVSIIAHSFGTYIVAMLLQRQFNLQLGRVIFCGSVVRSKFPFEQIDARYEGAIVNEVGTADPWPALAESRHNRVRVGRYVRLRATGCEG